MILLHQIGPRVNSNFNTIDEIKACNKPMSFDGIYESVMIHVDDLIGKDVTLFVMGDYVGKDNTFDRGQPFSKYLDWPEILYVQKKLKAKLGWHTWTHRDLRVLSDDEVIKEVTPPFPMDYFAYPYGALNKRIAKHVENAGYKEAWSVYQGDGSQFQRRRECLNW